MGVAENFSGSRAYTAPSGPNARRGDPVEATREGVPISDGPSKLSRAAHDGRSLGALVAPHDRAQLGKPCRDLALMPPLRRPVVLAPHERVGQVLLLAGEV